MTAWRDIASAPRDGTWILAIVRGEYRPGVPFIPDIVMWGKCPIAGRMTWLNSNSDHGTETETDARVTHWMPLPLPPTNGANNEG